jgi:hypothetical protein
MHGIAKYSSRCSGWFHINVATGSPSLIPSAASALASRLERAMQSPIVVWPTDPSGRRNVTACEPENCSARRTTLTSDSW